MKRTYANLNNISMLGIAVAIIALIGGLTTENHLVSGIAIGGGLFYTWAYNETKTNK